MYFPLAAFRRLKAFAVDDPNPRQEELAAELLSSRGQAALEGMAWSLLSEKDRGSIRNQEHEENKRLQEIADFKADLAALIDPHK